MNMLRCTCTLLLACVASVAGAQRPVDSAAVAAIKARYRKMEVRIPMRDGVRLYTAIYVPRDTSVSVPFIMDRTPYGVGHGPDAYPQTLGPSGNPKFAESGFIFVNQDARGRNYSEGTFTEMTPYKEHKGPKDVDESTDSYDTIDWLIHNIPHSVPKVAIYGTSYPGFYTTASCVDPHPALKACEPGAPMTDLWNGDDVFHNGAFNFGNNFPFYLGFGRTPRTPASGPDPKYPRPDMHGDAYTFTLGIGAVGSGTREWLPAETAPLWDIVIRHPAYDAFWQARDISRHLHRVPAMMEVGGYYDAEDLAGPWRTYRAIERLAPGSDNHIVIGPWSHGGWATRGGRNTPDADGDALFTLHWSTKTGPWFRDSIEFPFYMHYLKDAPMAPLPKLLVFRTGGDHWDRYDDWPNPPGSARSLYLLPGGKLGWSAPSGRVGTRYSEYVSDPAHPVPVVDHPDPSPMPRSYMVGDNRFASARKDVLTFQTDPLTDDVTLYGPPSPELYVSTTGTDADFDVKLIDVFPDDAPNWPGDTTGFKVAGYQQLVRGEPFRGRYRHDRTHPEAFVPNTVDSLRVFMPAINHTFRKGHRIMVQIQSSWFPTYDRNPQTYVENIFFAKPEDYKAETMRVYTARPQLSRIDIHVLSDSATRSR
jgi:hypothetical protein